MPRTGAGLAPAAGSDRRATSTHSNLSVASCLTNAAADKLSSGVSRTIRASTVTNPIYDPSAFLQLAERTEYEAWLLEAVYALAEQELFPEWPDGVVYPLATSKAQFFVYGRLNIVIGDWRPGFLNAGAPLVFVATFKLLDLFLEWVLEANGIASTFRFQEKVRQLERPQIFPPLIEARPWLKDRVIGLYRRLEPLRGTIIHDRHFTATDGAIRVSSSRGKGPGPTVKIQADHLRMLARTVVSIFRYVNGTSTFDDLREKTLRHDLDELAFLHGSPLLGQQRPFYTRVRIYLAGSDPLQIDPAAIRGDLAARYPDQDCIFDARVLLVDGGVVVAAYLFPWSIFAASSPNWSDDIDPARFRTSIPDDIRPEHLHEAAG